MTAPAFDTLRKTLAALFRRWNLSTRLIVWSSLLFLVILGCIVYGIIRGVPYTRFDGRVGQLRAEMFRQLSLIANLHKEQIESWLGDKQKDLRIFARVSSLSSLLALPESSGRDERVRDVLREVSRVYPEFDYVELFELAGQTVLSSRDSGRRPFEYDEFLKRARLSGKGYLGKARMQAGMQWPVFRIGHPVFDGDGREVAMLVVALNPNILLKQLLDTGESLGESGEVVLVNEEGFIINTARYALPDGTRPLPLQHRLTSIPARLSSGGHEGIIEAADYREVPVVGAFRHIRMSPEWGLGLVVKIDQHELFAPLRREIFTILGMSLTAFVLLVLLIGFTIRKQTRLLKILGDTAARLSDRDLSLRSGIRGQDEVGVLGSAFDHMADRLQSLVVDLRHKVLAHQRTLHDLAQTNEELRQFTYIVSHDLRSPLLSIQGFTEELQMDLNELDTLTALIPDTLAGWNPEQAHALLHTRIPEDLRYIRASIHKMDGLINAILHLSRLGRITLRAERLNMSRLVEENIQALGFTIQEAGVSMRVGSLPDLVCDRIAMEQILGNLLSNAIKYLDSRRPGVVDVRGVVDEESGRYTLQVIDNGRGIASGDLEKIFVLFQRVGRQDTPGEGMGLAYVRTLVRRLGGGIVCDSTVGQGTTFTVTLPTVPPPTTEI
ncbi:MAG: sensor histidine kinase [Magnetococcales bacterium]|nr:sensor histidine kinase [Magnetococcales bacterium]